MRRKIRNILLSLIFSVVIIVLWGIILVSASKQGPEPTVAPDNNSATELFDPIYLPLVRKDTCTPQNLESPFAIQIAALHQIDGIATQLQPTQAISPTMSKAEYDAWFDQAFASLLPYLADSGTGYARVFIRWADIQPTAPASGQPPVYDQNWLQWYDNRLAQITQAGIKIIVTMGGVPPWAGDGVGASCPAIFPAHQADYQQFLHDLVARYSSPPYNVKVWEIFNEADNTFEGWSYACFGNHGQAYKDILAISQSVIKAIVPDATILMSGIAYDAFVEYGQSNTPFNRYFPDDVMAAGGASYFDALNFHYFPPYAPEWERWTPGFPPTCGIVDDGQGTSYDAYGIDVVAKKKHFANRMSTCFGVNKPVWLTELALRGVPTDAGSLRDQAYYVIKGYTRGFAAGIENITWYALATPNDPYEQSLLFNDTLTPKPAYYTYQALTRELDDFRYDRQRYLPGGEAYVFKNSCNVEKTVAWGSNAPIAFSPASSLRVVNYQGSVSNITDGGTGDTDGTQNGSIQVMLSSDPMSGSNIVTSPVPIPVFISVTSR